MPVEEIDVQENLVTLCQRHHNAIEALIREGKSYALLEAYKAAIAAGE